MTNIRPGAGGELASFGWGLAVGVLGSSFIARDWVKKPGPTATAPRNSKVSTASFRLLSSMDLRASRLFPGFRRSIAMIELISRMTLYPPDGSGARTRRANIANQR